MFTQTLIIKASGRTRASVDIIIRAMRDNGVVFTATRRGVLTQTTTVVITDTAEAIAACEEAFASVVTR